MKNENGTVEPFQGDTYTGDYYTVDSYVDGHLLSTEYYSGHFNGFGGIQSTSKQYFGSLKIYGVPDPEYVMLRSNRLAMETDFLKDGAAVLSAEAGDSITAQTTVTNCSAYDRVLEYWLTDAAGDTKKMDEQPVKAREAVTLKTDFEVSGTGYYQVQVKDVTNEARIQTANAGYLPIGSAITNEMIRGTYQAGDETIVISDNDDVSAPSVTLDGVTYTAVLEDGSLKLMQGEHEYAVKDNAAADEAYLLTDVDPEKLSISKSTGGNPIVSTDSSGNPLFTGDPAATVVGDTVYLITGHDTSAGGGYEIPEWICFSTKDLKDWKYEGVILKCADVPWTNNVNGAWASQMIPYKDKYYFYFCTKDKGTPDDQESIGVAVADKPQGPYTSLEQPLVRGTVTDTIDGVYNKIGGDIDPTVWIETDENGEEHRYLMWGNNTLYLCELNEDMTSVKDLNSDGQITTTSDISKGTGDIQLTLVDGAPLGVNGGTTENRFEEGPWLYRRQNADGEYYGQYYMFHPVGLPERMGYSTADNIWGPWTFQDIIIERTVASNTHHPAVIDFLGKTYLIYHNGMQPSGSGVRRSVCIAELQFTEDGSVVPLEDLSTGLWGFSSTIQTRSGAYLGHEIPTENTSESFRISAFVQENGNNTKWEIRPALYVPDGEDAEDYVSIQALNRPGMYLNSSGKAFHDANGTQLDSMTFRTVKALDGKGGVSFESVKRPGMYLTMEEGYLTVDLPYILSDCSFMVTSNGQVENPPVVPVSSVELDKDSLELIVEDTYTLTATVSPDDADDKTVTWTSSNDAVAAVDQNGKVTAVAEGTAVITASAGGKSDSCTVTVNKKDEEPGMTEHNINITGTEGGKVTASADQASAGSTVTLTVTPDKDYELEELIVTDTAETKIPLSDNSDGIYTFSMPDSDVTVRASFTEVTEEPEPLPVPVSSVELSKNILELIVGDTYTLTAAVSPEDADDKTVTWTSSNDAVATVDQNGKVTAVAEGTAVITASAGGKSDSCSVTVTKKETKPPAGTVDGDDETPGTGKPAQGGSHVNAPQTGDGTPLRPLTAAILISAAGITVSASILRRRRNKVD